MNSPLRVGVCGAAGRMGRTLMAACQEDSGFVVGAAIEAPGTDAIGLDAGMLAGLPNLDLMVTDRLSSALNTVDVCIDFTRPEATISTLSACREARVPIVIGTTGLSLADRRVLDEAAQDIAVVFAPNMSVGVNLCFKLLDLAARVLGDEFDVEIIEAHHRHKIDAPSGTAVRMGEVVAAALDRNLGDCAVYAREGRTGERGRGIIGFETVRGGDIVGEHTVMFAGKGERIEITHRASSRMNFALGALRAARWVYGRSSGTFDMQDVLGFR